MDIKLSPEQEHRLAELAARNGCSSDDLVRGAVIRLLEDARFCEAVRIGLAAADAGDFVPAEEVWANVERALKT